MAQPPKGILDDDYSTIQITDFQAGWITITGSLALPSNATPDILNLIPLQGRLRFRGGTANICALPGPADGAYPFYDSLGGKHYAIWCNGNLYDAVSGSLTTIASGVYTAGSVIGMVQLNGVLYWSCGQPNPVVLQFWDPVAATYGPVVSLGGVGVVDPPASSFLMVYLNSIVALNPTWNPASAGTVYQPGLFTWCATNQPGIWVGAESQQVGINDGGTLSFAIQFGIANVGVAPTRTLVVARSDNGGIFGYTGAFPTLQESSLNCPVGCLSADTVQYLPTLGLLGEIVFLGTDGQLWGTNGITANPYSNNIMDYLIDAVQTALAVNPNLTFSSGYNEVWQYYWVDVAGTQFVYRWQTQAWTKFQGWPSGPTFTFPGLNGAPAYFVAGNATSGNYFAQIAVDGEADNGVMPSVYYTTPYLHGGRYKEFKDCQTWEIAAYNTGAIYSVSGKSNQRIDGSYMQSQAALPMAPAGSSTAGQFILGQSLIGGTDVLGANVSTPSGGVPVFMQGRFSCATTPTKFIPQVRYETLKGNAVQLTIAYAGGQPNFDLLGIGVQYVPRGTIRGAGQKYNPTTGAPSTYDPYVAANS